jgi:nicotinate-nucleotide pyrophosphorylase (carboxylating)
MVRRFGTSVAITEHMDVRGYLFQPLVGASFVAEMTAAEPGILAGTELARIRGDQLEVQLELLASDGTPVSAGSRLLRLIGSADEIARGEDELLACVGKASGVATAAARMVAKASGRVRIVCGAWKKIAPELRKWLRHAIAVGGAGIRLVDEPFVYLDKNYVRMFGSITKVVERARGIHGRTVAVQIRGDTDFITKEASEAFKAGAAVLIVDTGNIANLRSVVGVASREGFRERVRIAFAGGVTSSSLDDVIAAGADIVDVGRSVIDAPLLDFRFDVLDKV